MRQLTWYALYQLGLRSGWYRWKTRSPRPDRSRNPLPAAALPLPLPAPDLLGEILPPESRRSLLDEADKALTGLVRLFGGAYVPIELHPPLPQLHWTEYETGNLPFTGQDIKLTWEPARLGWGFLLARAYTLNGDQRFSACFWRLLEEFLNANPPYLGMNWISAQEAALRLVGMVFCGRVFDDSPHSTPERKQRLAEAVVDHARRITATLAYARAQNNNHLLSEAAGLYTAGVALAGHPSAARWRRTGWKLFHQGIRTQIDEDGVYMQHSANYQRLVLQLALWVHLLASLAGDPFPEASRLRLASASRWLLKLLDRPSGRLPNLGPNDGANILPLSQLPIQDFRPVLQAALLAFMGERPFEAGPWDEMGLWLGVQTPRPGEQVTGLQMPVSQASSAAGSTPLVLRSTDDGSWAYLRAARFSGRPGHADQLHLDLWWRGLNVALDPGTYLYNAAPPWENALSGSDVHNTLTVDGIDQMQRVGKFLYLNWAQARLIQEERAAQGGLQQAAAEHNGYRGAGVTHRRIVTVQAHGIWQVEDQLLALRTTGSAAVAHLACLHWLLPDWPWEIDTTGTPLSLRLASPQGSIVLNLSAGTSSGETGQTALQLVCAGEPVFGGGDSRPHWGWYSATYGEKFPALSVRFSLRGRMPLYFRSEWRLA